VAKKIKAGRVGRKRSDKRWRSSDGTIWASKFECRVYEALRGIGIDCRKCDERDTIHYVESRGSSRCLECGSTQIVQDRTYTPDICVSETTERGDKYVYYIEVKGYFREDRRSLFRKMVKSNPTYPIRVIFEKDGWVTKGRTHYSDYFDRYLKTVRYHIWDGGIPEDWKNVYELVL
jgi:hypothetical protein